MKILVSSKALAKKLSEIDFDNDSVYNVVLENNQLSINTNTKSEKIMVDTIIFKAAVKQENRGWNHISSLLNSVPDQPIALQISEACTSVIFQY